jgi:sulfopropanediol 3-dehydrogenase
MIRYLKTGALTEVRAAQNRQVSETVRSILDDLSARGDVAVRELSARFDGWDRDDFRLTEAEIDACIASLPKQAILDIEFAQTQVRTFAEHQKSALRDIEVETLPGVVLGHRNLPIQAVGCYVPGGK